MQIKLASRLVIPALCVVATACVDDNYDLSDIDTTTRVTVDNLTVPVNIDPIVLSDIISIDEDSKIQIVNIEGKEFYALTESGNFSSDPIYIDKVTASAPSLAPSRRTLQLVAGTLPGAQTLEYQVEEMGNDLSYSSGNIDKSIVALNSAQVQPMTFRINFEAIGVAGRLSDMTFSDLNISMPKGLTASTSTGSYDPATGVWTIGSYSVAGNTAQASLTATAIDFAANGCKIENHSLHFDSEFRVTDGRLALTAQGGTTLPQSIDLQLTYHLDAMTINAFSGVISYELEGMDIDPVDLTDIPDFLGGEQTDISLANPQIYLQVNNPVADYDLECRTGITLTAMRTGDANRPFSPDVNEITIGYAKGVSGPYNFVLAPTDADLSVPAAFASPEFVRFSTLGDLLATPATSTVKGLPDRIGIELDNPGIKQGAVSDFALGRNISGITGRYELMAPLALNAGSVIVYSDTKDGWNDEDVDAITISELTVTATASNNAPLGASITAYPIDVNGNRISGVTIVTESELPANTTDAPIRIVMQGEIRHLDGVTFEARVVSDQSGAVLTPSQTITLRDVRAKVSGYYEKEL